MRAIILAAGRGSRMKSLTNDRPKCLVELDGIPLIERQLRAIREAGIKEIGIVTGYKNEMLKIYKLHEFHNSHWAETQMVTSLFCAAKWLKEESCIVSYSDIFYVPKAVKLLKDCVADLAITYDSNWKTLWTNRFSDPLLDAETFKIDDNDNLIEIGNKPNSIDEIQGQYMGLLKFTPAGWAEFEAVWLSLSDEQQNKIHMTSVLQKLIDEKKMPISALPYEEDWGEIDSEGDLIFYESR